MHKASFLICLVFTLSFVYPQGYETSFEIFWPENLLVIYVSTPLVAGQVLPIRRLQTENLVKQNLSEIILKAVSSIIVDYRGTIWDYALEIPSLYSYLLSLNEKLLLDFSRANSEFTQLLSRFSLPLTNLTQPFIRHDRAQRISSSIEQTTSNDITGIVIYAAEPLPVHGENKLDYLRPSLFPRILDINTNVIFSKEVMDPNLILNQPAVLYTNNLSEAPFRNRIGNRPLRLAARGVFGRMRNDIILLDEDVRRILSTENGIKALIEGRILIILR